MNLFSSYAGKFAHFIYNIRIYYKVFENIVVTEGRIGEPLVEGIPAHINMHEECICHCFGNYDSIAEFAK